MKIALICDSLLLDRSLEMYLREHLTSYKLCDFVVATQPVESQKPVFLIGDFQRANLKIPFTREILLQELESFEQQVKGKAIQESKHQESQKEQSQTYFGLQEQNEAFIKEANIASVGFDNLKIPQNKEMIAPQESLQSPYKSDFSNHTLPINNPANNPISSYKSDSTLSAKIEEILHRFSQEIEAVIKEHYRDNNA